MSALAFEVVRRPDAIVPGDYLFLNGRYEALVRLDGRYCCWPESTLTEAQARLAIATLIAAQGAA